MVDSNIASQVMAGLPLKFAELNEKAFIASLFSFKYRYDIDIQFIGKENAGKFIYNSFYYYLREGLMR